VRDSGPQIPRQRFTLLYDESCELCRRCRHWLSSQPTHVDLTFLACGAPEAVERYGDLPWYKIELMLVAEDGRAWIGASAFVMSLWATVRYRPASYRLQGTHFAPLAERFFHALSANRGVVSGMLSSHQCSDGSCTSNISTSTSTSSGTTHS